MKNAIISLKSIGKRYLKKNSDTHALKSVDLDIFEGDYISISGPSGCGKSTLLSIVGLLDRASSGTYMIAGNNTQELDNDQLAALRNEHIGFVFQSFNLIDEISVVENVMLPLLYRDPPIDLKEATSRVERALGKVDMLHRKDHKPNELSGGQQQRIAIARAIVGEPTILLVDEPTGNLDSKNGDAVMQMLKSLNDSGTTILMVTHDQRYAKLAKRQVQLFDGDVALNSEVEAAHEQKKNEGAV